jgi:fructokinase
MKDVMYSIGEALIDFIPAEKGIPLKDVTSFERVAGGAPSNVAAALAKLGGKSSVITKLGEDSFGDYIIETLKSAGVDTLKIYRTKEANTALAFVSLKEDGNRDFSFYRNPSADMLLGEDEIKEEWFDNCHTLHFCSVDLIEAPVKYAHKRAIELALKKDSIISFDPNVRLPLWNDPEECRKTIVDFLPNAHIVKISDEELEFITGYANIEEAKDFLFKGNCKILIYTKGANGAELYTKNKKVTVDGIKTNVVDTTGAGDSFIGAFLYSLLNENITIEELDKISDSKLEDYLNFANIYASNSTTKKGAISAMATKEEILKLI